MVGYRCDELNLDGSDVMPQPALSCDVHKCRSSAKSYQDFSLVMNKIVGARLNQM